MPIPQEKLEAVNRALNSTFGRDDFEDIRILTRGLSGALVFRIVVTGTPYLLRIISRKIDTTRADHFACMNAAAEAGLAPRVHYTSVEDGIAITDFVATVPFPQNEALARLPGVLRKLHALPPFPPRDNSINTSCTFLLNQHNATDEFNHRFRSMNILPNDETEQLIGWQTQLAAAYARREPEPVSSHNDLFRPDNILFDGNQVWLVDWEAAFLNDRYADLATAADFVIVDDDAADEPLFLASYFGKAPSGEQLARFAHMRSAVHLFYTMVFTLLGSAGQPVNLHEDVPDFADFHRRLWAGELTIADKDVKLAYAKVHFHRLLNDFR